MGTAEARARGAVGVGGGPSLSPTSRSLAARCGIRGRRVTWIARTRTRFHLGRLESPIPRRHLSPSIPALEVQ